MYVEEISKLILDFIISYSGVLLPSSIALTYVSASLSVKNVKKYKLERENKVENCKVIHESNALKTIRNAPKRPIVDKEIIDIVNEAIETLSHEVSPETMEIIKRNLTTVGERKKDIITFCERLNGVGGIYNYSSHSIINLSKDKNAFRKIVSHELMHAASSYNYNGQRGCGFHQKAAGLGLNEGYTELIAQRYFFKDQPLWSSPMYQYQKAIAEITELIVGKERMQELYFQADLKGLISELSKYQEEDKVKQFILDLDTLLNITRGVEIPNEDMIMAKLYHRVKVFLYDCFSQKSEKMNIDKYLKESKEFLTLFSNIKEPKRSSLKYMIERIADKAKTKKLTRKKDGYVNIISMSSLLLIIIVISVLIAYLMIR